MTTVEHAARPSPGTGEGFFMPAAEPTPVASRWPGRSRGWIR